MKTTPRPAAGLRVWLGYLVTGALALGTVSAAALSSGTAGASAKRVTVTLTTIGNKKVLVANGKPLYYLTTPSSVACGAGCLKVWPALTVPAGASVATAGKGLDSGDFGTTTDALGQTQVTYYGKPVYWFAYDNVHGKVKGNLTDKWGKWNDVLAGGGTGGSSGSSSSGSSSSGSSSSGSGGVGF